MKHLLVVRPFPSHFNGLIKQSKIWCRLVFPSQDAVTKRGGPLFVVDTAVARFVSCFVFYEWHSLWSASISLSSWMPAECGSFFFFLKLLFPWTLSLVPLGSVSWMGLLNVDSGLNTHVESTEHTDHLAAGKRCCHIAVCHCCYGLKA